MGGNGKGDGEKMCIAVPQTIAPSSRNAHQYFMR